MKYKGFTMITCLVTLLSLVLWTNGMPLEEEIPSEISECIQTLIGRSNNSSDVSYKFVPEEIETICVQQFMWKFEDIQWSNFDITEKDKRFINSLIGSIVYQSRQKRQALRKRQAGLGLQRPPVISGWPRPLIQPNRPKTGMKIRKEYRRLSDTERQLFHDTLRRLKTSGQYDTFANMHSGTNVNSAHNGPNFPGWHRVYLALFEEAMRQASPGTSVSLPYWDSTLDFDMQDPSRSIIWSTPFLGNGDGQVTTGPFANWTTNSLNLVRNVGGSSRLFSKEIIERILTRCRNSEILTPTAQPDFDFEFFHGGPHVWVGGHMSLLNSAAFDPVFFMHHAFVDYIWELFRARQVSTCGVNPETDYPSPPNDLHAPERVMDGLTNYQNIDGYRNYWTQYWYRYEQSPTCSNYQSSCGSPYLRCDVQRQRCVSVEGSEASQLPVGKTIPGSNSFGSSNANTRVFIQNESVNSRITSFSTARALETQIMGGAKFRAPESEPRAADAVMSPARRR